MTTYYSIHIHQKESEKTTVEENSFPEIYEDINDACDALDKLICNYDISFVSPYRSDLIDIPEHLNNVFVYHMIGDMFFGILRRKIVPKKKEPVYSYSATCRSQGVMVSQDYTSFNDICDRLDKELKVVYERLNYQKILETRREIKELLDKNLSVMYGIFDDGKGAPLTYTLMKRWT